MDREQANLYDLAGGAAAEKFNIELMRVAENILDPNTTEAKRTITLKVGIKPLSTDRRECAVEITCTSSLAPDTGIPSLMYLWRTAAGRVEVYENNPKQLEMDLAAKDAANRPANVEPINQERGVS